MQFWNEWQGKNLAGRYTLGRLLRSEGRNAWFEAKDDQQKSSVLSVTESLNDEDRLLANLQAVSRLRHNNIVAIEKSGRATVDGTPVVYAVLEPVEENLADVLRERPLTPDETTQIAESLVAALNILHEHDLAHGHVNAGNVLASGDTVKLRTDCVQLTPVEQRADRYSQDTGDLGATLYEALTQRKLSSPADSSINKLPPPFRAIVQSSTSGRWTLADIAAALKKPELSELRHPVPASTPEPRPEAKPTPPVAASIHSSNASSSTGAIPPGSSPASAAAAPVVAHTPPPPPAEPATASSPNRLAVRLIAIVAIVAVAAAVWYLTQNHSASSTNSAATPDAATVNQPTSDTSSNHSGNGANNAAQGADPDAGSAAGNQAAPRPPASAAGQPADQASDSAPAASSPDGPTSSVSSAPAEVAADTNAAGEHKIWRVVVYTFARQSAAEHKVADLTTQHPELKPEVFSAKGHAPWLVVLGGPMDQSAAFHLRNQVRSEGFPADTYAQNYTH